MKKCTIEGCDRDLYARDWCEMHYARWRRKGDTSKANTGVPLGRAEIVARFDANVVKTETCWLWKGAINGAGYGSLSVDGKSVLAHRLSWDLFKQQKIGGSFALHHCDVKNCVNPDHLFRGDQSLNILDAYAKGRAVPTGRQGVLHPMSKLNEGDVRAILASASPLAETASIFGISEGTVRQIRGRKIWRHLRTPRPAKLGGARGAKNTKAKLTENDVYKIRNSTLRLKEIAKAFGISVSNVNQIRHRKTWTHLP